MRRVMLLALLALALPMAMSADQIRYNTGTQNPPSVAADATWTAGFPTDFTASVTCPSCTVVPGTTGGLVTITFTTTNLDCGGAPTCTFTDGNITVSRGSSILFKDSVMSGANTTILETSTQFVLTGAELQASGPFVVGGTLGMAFQFDKALGGNASIVVDTNVPEPGTLGLLGTGLVGLAGMARRKLKLPI